MGDPIERIVAKVVSDILHRESIRLRRLKVLIELQLLAKDDQDNAATDYQPAINALSK